MLDSRFTTDEEEFASYNERWSHLKREFFKLETLQRYADEFSPGFSEYALGRITDEELVVQLREAMTSGPDPWYDRVQQEGLKYNRVHIVDLPLSAYLRYELKSYDISRELGEHIFLITTQEAQKVGSSLLATDFIMFDDEAVFVQHYDEASGDWQYTELVEDPAVVARYGAVRAALLEKALPMEDFLREHANAV